MNTHFATIAAFSLLSASAAFAQGTADASKAGALKPGASATAGAPLTQGEVTKVDKDAGKITIKHGPIANLEMPGMTMVFRVKEPAMLEQVKAGDQIRFAAEKAGGAITVTRIESGK